MSELLELPSNALRVAGLAAGYPAREGKRGMRLPLSVTVHLDRYDNRRFVGELGACDHRREAAEPTLPEKQRMREQHGTLPPYGWSEDKARPYSGPERHSFGPCIRAQGFALK